MSSKYQLSERHQNVLRATVRHYVATAEPVGSKTIAQEYGFQVSSATIRNVMGSLEKVGLLYQPHTSAGRIPSDSGYRIYVDRLIAPNESWGRQLEELYTQQLDWGNCNIETLLQRAAQILATLSGYIALVTLPQNDNNNLRHIQVVQTEAQQVMLIVVTAYQTQSIILELALPLEEDTDTEDSIAGELQLLSNFLNHKLRGRSLSALSSLDWGEIDREFQRYTELIRAIIDQLNQQTQLPPSTSIVISGISEALRQPEFARVKRIQTLLHLLEKEQEQLLPTIFARSDIDGSPLGTTVRIGAENLLDPLNSCALIAAKYRQKDIPIGSVGVIGPTRMFYENAIALVEAAANSLSEALS
ncbi:MAG: heat-inducible transcriptional repressor HrcA [Cyanobacteriota bacterium]|nr:heat-inducible transcriptional repressor HrcA [Cyanobacteriota bacterium]